MSENHATKGRTPLILSQRGCDDNMEVKEMYEDSQAAMKTSSQNWHNKESTSSAQSSK